MTRYSAKEIFNTVIKQPLPYDNGIAVLDGNPRIAALNRNLPGVVSYYSFTLIQKGKLSLRFNGIEFWMKAGDLFICPPGIGFDVLDCSADLESICVMAEESFTCQLAEVKNVIKAAYFPVIYRTGYVTMSSEEAIRVRDRIREIREYYNNEDHLYKIDCLRMLYNLLVLDILNVQARLIESITSVSERSESIFIDFISLIQRYSQTHHDIPFYAGKLALSPIYLSRVVKKLTGRTVMDFINQMLVIEATSLLKGSDMPISEIAERIGFATAAGFSKFFSREIGVSPRVFRSR